MGERHIEKTETFCDLCHRTDSVLTKCVVCGVEYCLCCGGGMWNAFNQNLCNRCVEREDVVKVLDAGLVKFHAYKKIQVAKLSELPERLVREVEYNGKSYKVEECRADGHRHCHGITTCDHCKTKNYHLIGSGHCAKCEGL